MRRSRYKEVLGSHNRDEERVCTEKGEDVSIVKRREERGACIYQRTIEERVYQILKITSNTH